MQRNTQLSLVLALSLVAVVAFGNVAPARANAPIVVNSTLDEPDDWPGYDGCLTEFTGVCTLRAAIMEANALTGADTIILPASAEPYQLTRAGFDNTAVNGDLDLNTPLTITGGGAASTIIDGGNLDRVFHVTDNVNVTITGVTIRHGNANLPGGGGIYSPMQYATLTLADSVVTENKAFGGGEGGGIHSAGTLMLTNVVLSDNHTLNTDGRGGGLFVPFTYGNTTITSSLITGNSDVGGAGGGGIRNGGTMILNYTTVSGNTGPSAYSAGGISNWYGTLTLNHSTVSGNQATSQYAYAGGIVNVQGTLILNDSTVSGNQATHQYTSGAGGLYNDNEQGGSATLTNSTLSGNSTGNIGGGILNTDTGVLYLRSVTVAGNRADSDDGYDDSLFALGGGIANSGAAYLRNTLIAGNVRGAVGDQDPDDCSGPLTSEGYNLLGTGFGCNLTGDLTGNQTANPNLGGLAYNGGATQTHALLAGSPAIDAGNLDGCNDSLNQGLPTDQRGFSRLADGDGANGARCDIGAFEFTPAFFQVFVPIAVK